MNKYDTQLQAKVGEQNRAVKLLKEWFPRVVTALKPFEGKKGINTTGEFTQKVREVFKSLNFPHNTSEQIFVSACHGYSVSLRVTTTGLYPDRSGSYHRSQSAAEVYAIVATKDRDNQILENIPAPDECPEYRDNYTVEARLRLKEAQKLVSKEQSNLHFFGEYDN